MSRERAFAEARVLARQEFCALSRVGCDRESDVRALRLLEADGPRCSVDAAELQRVIDRYGYREEWRQQREEDTARRLASCRAMSEGHALELDRATVRWASALGLAAQRFDPAAAVRASAVPQRQLFIQVRARAEAATAAAEASQRAAEPRANAEFDALWDGMGAPAAPGDAHSLAQQSSALIRKLGGQRERQEAASVQIQRGWRLVRHRMRARRVLAQVLERWVARRRRAAAAAGRGQARRAAVRLQRHWRQRRALQQSQRPSSMRSSQREKAAAATLQGHVRARQARHARAGSDGAAGMRARRRRKCQWSRLAPQHRTAAEPFRLMALAHLNIEHERARLDGERAAEAQKFSRAFQAWDKRQSKVVMAAPLHAEWVPQIDTDTGLPSGYLNVKTRVVLPFHPHVQYVQENSERGRRR